MTSHTSQTCSHHPLLQRPLPSLTPLPHLTFGNPEKGNTWLPFSGPFRCRGPRIPSATVQHQPHVLWGDPPPTPGKSVSVRSVNLLPKVSRVPRGLLSSWAGSSVSPLLDRGLRGDLVG